MSNRPTQEHLAAVEDFARKYATGWKVALQGSWRHGSYPFAPGDSRIALLQQVRNQFGPAWLKNYRRVA